MSDDHKCPQGKRHCDFENDCFPRAEFSGDEHRVEPLHHRDGTVPWDADLMRDRIQRFDADD